MILAIVTSLRHLLGWVVSAFRSRENLVLENLALRQQLLALHAKRPRRRMTALHKLFWIALKTFWSGWHCFSQSVAEWCREALARNPVFINLLEHPYCFG